MNRTFLFSVRRRDRIKGLLWEGDGFLLLYKRPDNGCFRWSRNETEAKLLKEQLAQLKKYVYGQKSEKTEIVLETGDQIPMFNEAEQEAEVNPKNVRITEVKAHKRVR